MGLDKMKNMINEFLEKENLTYIDIHMSNMNIISAYKPNSDDINSNSIVVSDNGVIITKQLENIGCASETYLPYEKMVYVDAIFNCPKEAE